MSRRAEGKDGVRAGEGVDGGRCAVVGAEDVLDRAVQLNGAPAVIATRQVLLDELAQLGRELACGIRDDQIVGNRMFGMSAHSL